MLISFWLCNNDNEWFETNTSFNVLPPEFITLYTTAAASVNYSDRMLKVGLQTNRLQQTWNPHWLKISSCSDIFKAWKQMVVWSGQIRWMGSVCQHFKMQICQLLLCDDSHVWRDVVLEKKKQLFLQLPLPFIETIAYFTLFRRDI